MNINYGLTGTNKYKDDLTIVSIKNEDIKDLSAIIMPRFEVGGRWFDDVVDNNVRREKSKQQEKTKFKKTDIISPIFGKIEKTSNEEKRQMAKEHIEELLEEEDKDYKQVLEATMDLSPLKEEIKRNDEFLASLKEFRRNL